MLPFFASRFLSLGEDSKPKEYCDALNYLESLYAGSSVMDKAYTLNFLGELANQMRAMFPKIIQGTSALERKILKKIYEIDHGNEGCWPIASSGAFSSSSSSVSSSAGLRVRISEIGENLPPHPTITTRPGVRWVCGFID